MNPIHLAVMVAVSAVVGTPCFALTELRIELLSQGLTFELTGEDVGAPWVLQHSADSKAWTDLAYIQERHVNLAWSELPKANAATGLFRAYQLEGDDPFLKRFLDQRSKWRRASIDDYVFEVSQGFGMVSWHGIVTVTEGAVASAETIDVWPPIFEVIPPTVDELFDRIARAIAQDAATIDVEWDVNRGFPTSCAIDFSELIADEEQNWRVGAFEESVVPKD